MLVIMSIEMVDFDVQMMVIVCGGDGGDSGGDDCDV